MRLLVAWQVAYDYLDTVGEEISPASPAAAAELYSILGIALDPAAEYRGHSGDGGHLDRLVACCRASVAALPSIDAVGPFAVRAAERCAAAQAVTHTVAEAGPEPLRRWALAQPGTEGFLWWEVAAGAISSLGVHALLATAALGDAAATDAARVDAAYFPSICALSTLLDSTIDAVADAGTQNHRCTGYYDDAAHAAERIETVARTSAAAARGLPRAYGHTVALAGMTAYYASSDDAGNEWLHLRVARALGLGTGPILWTLGLRRRLREGGSGRAQRRPAVTAGTGGWVRRRRGRRATGRRGRMRGAILRPRTGPGANAPARRWGISAEDGSAQEGVERGVRGLDTSPRDLA